MYSLNRAQIVGNVTRDPEMRYIPSGQAVCSFGLATNRRWRDKDGNNQEQTEFHNIVAWQKAAEIISQYVKKGTKLYVEGRLQTRSWEGQDGGKRNRTEIVVENFIILTPKGATAAPVSAEPNLGEDVKEFPIDKGEEKPTEDTKSKKAEPKPAEEKEKTPAGGDDDDINLDEIPF